MVVTPEPSVGWTCRCFEYISEDTTSAMIYLADAPGGAATSVTFSSWSSSGWHGNWSMSTNQLTINFNCRGKGEDGRNAVRSTVLFRCQNDNEAWRGYDYRGRRISAEYKATYYLASVHEWVLLPDDERIYVDHAAQHSMAHAASMNPMLPEGATADDVLALMTLILISQFVLDHA